MELNDMFTGIYRSYLNVIK